MSEKEKETLSQFLTEMFKKQSESLQNQINEAVAGLKSTSNSNEPPKKPHTHSGNVEFECKDCQQEYDKAVTAKAISEFKEKLKKGELVQCDNCGEIVGEETEECPTCKGRTAHKLTEHY